jgi:hypothetical protein
MKPAKSPLLEASERRRHPRKGTRLFVRYEAGGHQYLGHVIDVSLGGLCLEGCQAHQVGQPLALSFKLFPNRELPLNILGKVVSCEQRGFCTWWIGIEFRNLDSAAHKDLAFFVLN